MSYRYLLLIIGLFGLTGVGLGAFGAHALHEMLLARGMHDVWETAVTYQLIHTVALLAVGLWAAEQPVPSPRMIWAARCWALGIVLFSGSLYGLALGGPKALGPITPLGGLAFIVGWGCLIIEALKSKRPAKV